MTTRLLDLDSTLGANAAVFQSAPPPVHPNEAGSELIAEAIIALLDELSYTIEIAFGSTWKTADASVVWTDVTSYVRHSPGVTATRGRRSLQQQFATGNLSFELLNQLRTFDPTYTAGPYYGKLLAGVPVRVQCTVNTVTVPIFRGFISGFPQRYDVGNTLAWVPVSGYGVFDKLARAKLPQSAVDVEVLADVPSAYWKLDDTIEAEMHDSSGNDFAGVYDNPTLTQDPLVDDGGKAVYFDHVGDHRGKANLPTGMPVGFPATLEAWVNLPTRDLTLTRRILGVQRDTSYLSSLDLLIETSGGGSPNGEVVFNFRGLGTFRKARGSTRIDDGQTHHIVLSITDASTIALYVDGGTESMTVISGTDGGAWAGHFWWVIGNLLDVKVGDYGLQGTVDNVAVYASALSLARSLAHYNAGNAPWDGDTTDARLNRILDVVGLPADRRSFQACTTVLGSTVLNQQRALDYMRLVEASEDGRMFETADGKIRFLDRYWGVTDSHATSSQQTFSDLGSVSYSDLEIDPDDELIVNICTVQRENATALPPIVNQTSIDTYGPADTSVSVLLQTDAEARSLGEHIVLVRGTPGARVSKLRVPLHKYTGTQQAAILALDIGYQITVNRTPQGVGSAMALSLIIEGIDHTFSTVEHWVEFNVSVANASIVALWGTSNWDSGLWGW
jgi:hypothetical protein